MKTKIVKILGVVLTLTVLASMLVIASPVSAGTQAWSKISLPASGSAGKFALAGFDVLGDIAQTKDGSAIYMGAGDAWDQDLYKSTDFGRTWTLVAAFPSNTDYTGQIFDIECSSADVNTVYITDADNIFKTVNGGTSWITIASMFDSSLISPTGDITSISVGYLGNAPYIFATTSTWGSGLGGAYVCQESVFGSPWSDLNVGTDRDEFPSSALDGVRIVVLPDFATTQGVMLLWTDVDGSDLARVSTKFGGGQWDTVANDLFLASTSGSSLNDVEDTLLNGNIFLPSDFSSNPNTGLMQAFISINPMDDVTGGGGDVYLAYFGPAAPDDSPTFDLNVRGTDTATNISGMSGVGTSAGAYIMVSGYSPATPLVSAIVPAVYTTKNGGQTWTAASKRPTGGASPLWSSGLYANGVALSVCLVKSDFATSGQALVATQGDDAGVSFTADFGVTFNTISMINNTIGSLIDISLTSDNTIYAITDGGYNSVWRNMAGVWERVNSESLYTSAPEFSLVEAVPDNSAVFVTEDASGFIWRSTDKGQTWKQQLTVNPGGAFDTWFVGSANSVMVADGGTIYQTATNGVVWFTRVVSTAFIITDIRQAANGDFLVAGSDGGTIRLARSTDAGLSWTAFDTGKTGTTTAFVAPADDYATTGVVFFTGESGAIWTGAFASSTTWKQTDKDTTYPYYTTTVATGLVSAVGGPGNSSEGTGMVYVMGDLSDNDPSSATIENGTARVRGHALFTENIAKPSSTTLSGLWLGANSVGGVALYSIGADANIWTYTDTLNKAGTGVAVSAITSSTATITFPTLANASDYLVVVNTIAQTSFYTADSDFATVAAPVISTDGLTATVKVKDMDSTTLYYISVWASAPVSSFMFGGASSFTTNPSVPSSPSNWLVPAPGAQMVMTFVNFQWDQVTGATSYELWLDTKLDFSTAQKYTGIPAPAGQGAADFAPPAELLHETLYFWKVRAVTATGVSDWNGVWSFTTTPAPTPIITIPPAPTPTIVLPTPPPAVTITQAAPVPAPVITITQPSYTIAQPPVTTPTYIWIIVGVGALLTLAVIVLIIRTRRVV